MKINETNDFGFSTYDEAELVEAQEDTRAVKIYDLVMPLLKNLQVDSHKPVIKWPNRQAALEALINEINEIMEIKSEVELFE